MFLRRAQGTVTIENFLLSCQVFSHGIEQAVLATVLRQAADQGAREVLSAFHPTAKNHHVRDFYPRHSFTALGPCRPGGSGHAFHLSLDDPDRLPVSPDHITLFTEGNQ